MNKKNLLFKNLGLLCIIAGAIIKFVEGMVSRNNMENMVAKEVKRQLEEQSK